MFFRHYLLVLHLGFQRRLKGWFLWQREIAEFAKESFVLGFERFLDPSLVIIIDVIIRVIVIIITTTFTKYYLPLLLRLQLML